MKKRLLIICSLIGVLLAGFQFPIYAEETTPDYSSSTSIITSAALDQYFYDNYDLLPYIESNGSQYINTLVKGKSDLRISVSFSDLLYSSDNSFIFGSAVGWNNQQLRSSYIYDQDRIYFYVADNTRSFEYVLNDYNIYDLLFDNNKVYINGSLINEFTYSEFNNNLDMYIFNCNNNGSIDHYGSFKLYRFSIYDYAANEGEGALIRDYYPARSKSGGVIGLYDAVNKTFVTTSGSVPFASPTGDPVNLSLGANVTQFLSGSLSWIGAIFEGINDMPIIWVFMAIGLAGAMFRWARRLVHF